jgi:hypothetical protein
MKKSNVILSEWREKMIKEHFPDVEVPLLHFLYCSAHVLLGLHSEVDSNLQQLDKAEGILNNIKESRAVKTIRRVCELFGPRGSTVVLLNTDHNGAVTIFEMIAKDLI